MCDKATAIFTCCLALDNKIEYILSITCSYVRSSKTTLSMSKEAHIVTFVKSNNNESHVP